MARDLRSQFGWRPDPDGVSQILADPGAAVVEITSGDLARMNVGATEHRMGTDRAPVVLFDALMALEPRWKRAKQAIGDCVSHGFELAASLVVAVDIVVNRSPWQWRGTYATEPIYGGSRVEAAGVNRGGWEDGSYGAAAAKWLTKWGALLRVDYSIATGNREHDLRVYSGEKARNWGNYGCGGVDDKGKLDDVAKENPVAKAYLTKTFAEAAASIESGYPVAVCSMQGLSARGADGFARPEGTWPHCMCFAGVRYDKPGLLIANSWGNSWGIANPFYPATYPHGEVIKCCAWVDARTCDKMLGQGDSYALTGVQGLVRREIDWSIGWDVRGRR